MMTKSAVVAEEVRVAGKFAGEALMVELVEKGASSVHMARSGGKWVVRFLFPKGKAWLTVVEV